MNDTAARLQRLRDAQEATCDALDQAIAERDRLNAEIEMLRENADHYQRQIRSTTTYD